MQLSAAFHYLLEVPEDEQVKPPFVSGPSWVQIYNVSAQTSHRVAFKWSVAFSGSPCVYRTYHVCVVGKPKHSCAVTRAVQFEAPTMYN